MMVEVKYYGDRFFFDDLAEAQKFGEQIIMHKSEKFDNRYFTDVEINWVDIDDIKRTLILERAKDDKAENNGNAGGSADA